MASAVPDQPREEVARAYATATWPPGPQTVTIVGVHRLGFPDLATGGLLDGPARSAKLPYQPWTPHSSPRPGFGHPRIQSARVLTPTCAA